MDFDVVSVGEGTIDAFLVLPDTSLRGEENPSGHIDVCFRLGEKIPVDSYNFLPGGSANNVAVGLSRLGIRTGILIETGSDEFSYKIINNLQKENIDASRVIKGEGSASFSVIIIYMGDRTIFVHNVERKHDFRFDFKTKYLYLASLGEEWKEVYGKVAEFVEKTGAKLAYNPGRVQIKEREEVKKLLKLCEVVFLNKDETLELLDIKENTDDIEGLLKDLKKLGAKIAVITDNKQGSYVLDMDGKFHHEEAVVVPTIEMTGAGDSYASGFLAAIINGKGIDEAMKWGSKNAASVVQKIGAQTGLLTVDEITNG